MAARIESGLEPITGIIEREEHPVDPKYLWPEDGSEAPDSETADGFTLSHPYAVPSDEAFGGKEFAAAADLREIAGIILAKYHEDFWYLKDAPIGFYWKRRKAAKGGEVAWYDTRKAGPLEATLTGAAYIVWLAADYCRDTPVTAEQVGYALVHSLMHIGWNGDKAETRYRSHEFAGYVREVEICGFWQPNLQDAAAGFQARFDYEDEPKDKH